VSGEPLLSVRDLVVEFTTEQGVVRAVDRVSFEVRPNETLGIVGESGCGKTVTGLAIMGLVPSPPGRIAGGSIRLLGRELVGLPESELRSIRGRDIAMVFQEPMTALNPVFTIGNQMTDVLRRYRGLSRRQARSAAIELLAKVGIPAPERRIDEYPHQLSGGMRQRVVIAMALSCDPKLIVADEPTTALDVTTQAQVLAQIVKLQQEFHMAMILVTHDLGVVAETCHRAMVMYCGRIAEKAEIGPLFAHPRHPYTVGLLQSIPRVGAHEKEDLAVIPGMVPDLLHLPRGCRFADRCPRRQADCDEALPELDGGEASRSRVACYHPHEART
jgi:oligopeptide/dipeptide ABC transporter ATP-binding protein